MTIDTGLQASQAFLILFAVAAYILGSVPFGKLISRRVADIDITQRGSGNIGATNVARVIGLKWGILTLSLDALKGFIPAILFRLLFPQPELGLSLVGLTALLGHQFSLFCGFRGGKGVATALGAFLAIAPIPSLLALALFVLAVYLSDYVSLGSLVSACAMPLLLLLHGKSETVAIASLIMAILICIKHKENIVRLTRGEERGWRKGRS